MIERKAFCDVCRQPIPENLTTLELRSGPLLDTLPRELHLCPDDAGRLASFIKGGPAQLPALGGSTTR